MAEWSGKWTTNAAGSGDQVAGYTQAYYQILYEVLAACLGFEGVAPGYLNELEGSVTGANTVEINTGGALVDGHVYQNGAAEEVNIPNAIGAGNTRIDRIVLRCDWSAYTVRLTRIAGTDAGSPSAPAITQTSGTTYDILLYQALVNTSGDVTLTDERTWAAANKIADGMVDADAIADDAVTPTKTSFISALGATGKIYIGSVDSVLTSGDLPDGWSVSKIGTGISEIEHNLGTTNYYLYFTPSGNVQIGFSNVGANSFRAETIGVISGSYTDRGYHFMLVMFE